MVSLLFEQDFESMLRKYESSLDDKKRFTALVKDLFPMRIGLFLFGVLAMEIRY